MALVLHVLRGSLAEGLENCKSDIDDAMIVSDEGVVSGFSYPCNGLVRLTYGLQDFRGQCQFGAMNVIQLLYCPVIYANKLGSRLIIERDSYITQKLYSYTLRYCSAVETRAYHARSNRGKELALVLKMLWWLYTAKTEQGLQVRPEEKLAKELKEIRAGKCDNYQTLLHDLMKRVNKVWNK